jgi:hypothetical protein
MSTYTAEAGRPGRLDMTTLVEGNAAPLHTTGIYSLSGDTLRYSVAAPGRPRPSSFTTEHEDGRTVVVLRRAGPGATERKLP